jgi:hypothetical protein
LSADDGVLELSLSAAASLQLTDVVEAVDVGQEDDVGG